MAETFTENSEQYSFEATFSSNFTEGETVTIVDEDGTQIYTYTVQKSGNSIVFSSPDLQQGNTYTVTVGEQSTEITLDSIASGSSSGMGNFGGAGSGMGNFSGGFGRK
jgi:hypothetical protein